MRYLTLVEALTIGEAVTGIGAEVLGKGSRIGLLDSALHAPQASFGGEEFYPELLDKAAVLVVRIARNHPLPDGNKRLAWTCLNLLCQLNGHTISCSQDDAVEFMLKLAAGKHDEETTAKWLIGKLLPV